MCSPATGIQQLAGGATPPSSARVSTSCRYFPSSRTSRSPAPPACAARQTETTSQAALAAAPVLPAPHRQRTPVHVWSASPGRTQQTVARVSAPAVRIPSVVQAAATLAPSARMASTSSTRAQTQKSSGWHRQSTASHARRTPTAARLPPSRPSVSDVATGAPRPTPLGSTPATAWTSVSARALPPTRPLAEL